MKFQTQGLILREKPVGEQGWLLTILTEDKGMLQAFVNRAGGKKERMPGAGLLCFSRLDIYQGREKYIISRAVPVHSFAGLRRDLTGMALAMYFCQLGAELIMVGDEDTGEALRLLLNALHFLEEGKRSRPLLKAVVELRLLTTCGYMPDLTGCAQCGAEEAAGMALRLREGVLYCGECRPRDEQPEAQLSPSAVRAMRHIVEAEFGRVFAFTLTGPGLEELTSAAEAYMLSILQEMPKTLVFYRSLE